MALNPNNLKINQVMDSLRSFGVSQLDAELLADCINVQKACTWQNNDELSDEAIEKTKAFLNQNQLGIAVEITPGRFGKFIWETTKVKN
jgi:D-alanyl-D-alanine carboxypeptidase